MCLSMLVKFWIIEHILWIFLNFFEYMDRKIIAIEVKRIIFLDPSLQGHPTLILQRMKFLHYKQLISFKIFKKIMLATCLP